MIVAWLPCYEAKLRLIKRQIYKNYSNISLFAWNFDQKSGFYTPDESEWVVVVLHGCRLAGGVWWHSW